MHRSVTGATDSESTSSISESLPLARSAFTHSSTSHMVLPCHSFTNELHTCSLNNELQLERFSSV
jgi:hypothetical protein